MLDTWHMWYPHGIVQLNYCDYSHNTKIFCEYYLIFFELNFQKMKVSYNFYFFI